jgi:pilus assembly protein CpaC
VLDGTRVNLKMVSEVSDLSQTGSPFTTINGVVSVLPSLTVRRADTTVQLNDGQSFVVAGLIKNNMTETIKRFPGLGEVPILGALFRSSEFQKEQTELLFVITPRLVKPLAEAPRLPTDNHVEPSRGDVYFNGSLEGSTPAPVAPARLEGFAPAPAGPAPETK